MMRVAVALVALVASVAALAGGCASHTREAVGVVGASAKDETGAIDFAFDSLDARPVSSAAMRGRPAVLAFVTTWDLSSQAQIDFLVPMSVHDGAASTADAGDGGGEKVRYAMIALQEPQDRELVEAFRATLKVGFPVALADRASIAGGGPFGDVHNVPTVVVLDRAGRVVWRRVGLARSEDIRAGLKGL